MRSKDLDRKKAVKLLERDLINGPNHCFGLHDACSSDFCSTAKDREQRKEASASSRRGSIDASDELDEDDDLVGMYTLAGPA